MSGLILDLYWVLLLNVPHFKVSLLSKQNRRIIDISNEYCDTTASQTRNFVISFFIML